MKLSPPRRALLGTTLALGASLLVAPASTAATTDPAPAAARSATAWLATQLTDGVIHNDAYDFDDLGLTADIGLALEEVGGDQALVRQVRQAMSSRVAEYAAPSAGERYSGSLAKSLVLAQATGADPRAFGGLDLVAETEARVRTDGATAGRLEDLSAYGDYANTFGQALAARGLSAAGSPQAGPVTDFLLRQQCTSGYFRVFFSDPAAADQTCVEGTDPTDTDATAMVVAQLATITPRPARVQAALDRATAWLASTQRADGSFVGSTFTPDPNSNSTGLAASALAAVGRCEQAGRAAEWVEGRQVGTQPASSPLVGEEGAIAYSDAALDAARTDGITVAGRDQWWRATVQAAAGLTHARGSVAGLTVTATPAEAGQTTTLTASGARTGDRFCLTGPGITGSRTLVVGADGTATARVTLPASGAAPSYTVTGRDGARSQSVGTGRGALAGVRLAGPTGFQRAGTDVALDVTGAAPGARFVLEGPGLAGVTVYAGSDGTLTRTVTLPKDTGTATYTLVGADGQVFDSTRVLGKRRLKVGTLRSTGDRTRLLVQRLVPREKVRLVVGGRTVAKGRANRKGRFTARVDLTGGRPLVRVKAFGQFPELRSGATTVSVR